MDLFFLQIAMHHSSKLGAKDDPAFVDQQEAASATSAVGNLSPLLTFADAAAAAADSLTNPAVSSNKLDMNPTAIQVYPFGTYEDLGDGNGLAYGFIATKGQHTIPLYAGQSAYNSRVTQHLYNFKSYLRDKYNKKQHECFYKKMKIAIDNGYLVKVFCTGVVSEQQSKAFEAYLIEYFGWGGDFGNQQKGAFTGLTPAEESARGKQLVERIMAKFPLLFEDESAITLAFLNQLNFNKRLIRYMGPIYRGLKPSEPLMIPIESEEPLTNRKRELSPNSKLPSIDDSDLSSAVPVVVRLESISLDDGSRVKIPRVERASTSTLSRELARRVEEKLRKRALQEIAPLDLIVDDDQGVPITDADSQPEAASATSAVGDLSPPLTLADAAAAEDAPAEVPLSGCAAQLMRRVLMVLPHNFTLWHPHAISQWNMLRKTIEDLGVQVLSLDQQWKLPSMVFVNRAGLVHKDKVYLSRFVDKERSRDQKYYRKWFAENSYTAFGEYYPLKFEGGGDAVFSDPKFLWAGCSDRIDVKVFDKIDKLGNFEVIRCDLVRNEFRHLDTCFAPLDEVSALWYPPAFSKNTQDEILRRLPQSIAVSDEEATALVCNAITVRRTVISPIGVSAKTRSILAERGFKVAEINMSEFLKRGGACQCLVLRL